VLPAVAPTGLGGAVGGRQAEGPRGPAQQLRGVPEGGRRRPGRAAALGDGPAGMVYV